MNIRCFDDPGQQAILLDRLHGQRLAASEGVTLTEHALLDVARPGYSVLVASDPTGVLVGALSFTRVGDDLHIARVGSLLRGTGSRLAAEMIRMAAASGKGLTLDTLAGALTFWERMGFVTTGPASGSGETPMALPAPDRSR